MSFLESAAEDYQFTHDGPPCIDQDVKPGDLVVFDPVLTNGTRADYLKTTMHTVLSERGIRPGETYMIDHVEVYINNPSLPDAITIRNLDGEILPLESVSGRISRKLPRSFFVLKSLWLKHRELCALDEENVI